MTTGTCAAAYYFPNYHPDPRNDAWHGRGWTEWELVKAARPRFAGHRQPIVPAWGCFDESDPSWAAREIDLAADHGITCFIYDYYWFEDGQFLQDGLDRGFLAAKNRNRLNFALMWANHDWPNAHPARFHSWDVLVPGAVSRARFDEMVDHVIARYFSQPNYLRVDGEPFFSIYELGTFIGSVGGLSAAADALRSFREKTRAAGFPGLHLNAIARGVEVLPAEVKISDSAEVVSRLGFSSIGSYTWVHHYPLNSSFPIDSYQRAAECNYRAWEDYGRQFSVPYFPNVTMGWDPSPRTVQSDIYEAGIYPWTSVLDGNTPDEFRRALERAKAFADRSGAASGLVTINAWNEWTEGSYLLPAEPHGTAYLEAVRDVFGAG